VAREVLEQGLTHSEPVWRGLAGLGATALMLPEDCGGAGLGAMELCVVAEEIGRQLSPVPLASTLYLAAQAVLLGGTAAQQQRWLSPVAEGAIGAFAAPMDGVVDVTVLPRFDGQGLTGTVALVADGGCATWAVVLAADGQGRPVWVVSGLARGLARRALATLAVAWVASHPAVTAVTPATSRAENMADNMGAARGRLPDAAMRRRMIALGSEDPERFYAAMGTIHLERLGETTDLDPVDGTEEKTITDIVDDGPRHQHARTVALGDRLEPERDPRPAGRAAGSWE